MLHGQEYRGTSSYLNRVRLYYAAPKCCGHCQALLVYKDQHKQFCNRSCAASKINATRTRSDDSKAKTSKALKGKTKSLSHQANINASLRKIMKPRPPCKVCGNPVRSPRHMTCSTKCKAKRQQTIALTQVKHGGGKKGRYKGIQCDSSYELAFLVYHLDHGSNIKRCEQILTYTFEGEERPYNPDFQIDDQIIELKGFYSSKTKAKLQQHPYIHVIDGKTIKPYIDYVKSTYQVKNVIDLYD